MSDSGKKPALSLSPARAFCSTSRGAYERIASEAERPLLVDVERARESLRGFIGDVRMIPCEKHELIAEARIDGAALLRKCLNSKGNRSVVAGGRFELYSAYPIRVPAVPASVFATR